MASRAPGLGAVLAAHLHWGGGGFGKKLRPSCGARGAGRRWRPRSDARPPLATAGCSVWVLQREREGSDTLAWAGGGLWSSVPFFFMLQVVVALENNCPLVIQFKCALVNGFTVSIISSLVCMFENFVCVL